MEFIASSLFLFHILLTLSQIYYSKPHINKINYIYHLGSWETESVGERVRDRAKEMCPCKEITFDGTRKPFVSLKRALSEVTKARLLDLRFYYLPVQVRSRR